MIHWPFDADRVQALLPAELTVDRYRGQAWVSLTPFLMAGVRPLGRLPLPDPLGLLTFPETNLRTYVRGPDGRDGLWFLSIEASSALVSMAARAIAGAPYHLGDLSVTEQGSTLEYAGTRRGGGPWYRVRVRHGARLEPSERDIWLTSRWRAYTHRFGTLLRIPVEHEPWPLRHAVVEELDQTLTAAAGLPEPAGDPLVHYSDGVCRVRVGVSRPLRPAVVHQPRAPMPAR